MRQKLGPKKLRRYSRLLGKEFTAGLVRGNTHHRVDLYEESAGKWWNWQNGELTPAWTEEDYAREKAERLQRPPDQLGDVWTWDNLSKVTGVGR